MSERRAKVATMLRGRGRAGSPAVFNGTREMHEDSGVHRSTLSRDWRAVDARYLFRPKTADITAAHKRCSHAQGLLSKDPTKIIFTDESLVDCADPERCQWVEEGGTPDPGREAKWTARAHVWGGWRGSRSPE